MNRFEIWLACMADGLCPVVILSSGDSCSGSSCVTVIPLTTDLTSRQLPSHVLLASQGLCQHHRALCEKVTTLNCRNLSRRIGCVDDPYDRFALNRAVAVYLHLTITPYIKEESIYEIPGDV